MIDENEQRLAGTPREIEFAALSAWPAKETLFVDGFVLRLDSGYTRRVNSATALFTFRRSVDESITRCETIFAKADLEANFRMLSAPTYPDLESELEARGYRATDRTLVQTRSLDRAPGPVSTPEDLRIHRVDREAWMQAFGAVSGQSLADQTRHAAILQRIRPKTLPLVASRGDEVVGTALGVVDGPWLGLFDFVVSPEHRRGGIGAALLDSALSMGYARGGRMAYLQVVEANQAARALYSGRGFDTRYVYHYRARPRSTSSNKDIES